MDMRQTQAEQDADLWAARAILNDKPELRIDRCRHDSVTATSLWIFKGDVQIGSITRTAPSGERKWNVKQMLRGMPVSDTYRSNIIDAVLRVLED